MKIVDVTLYRVRLPLVHSFETSSHRKDYLEHILVRLTDGSGATGWGEIASPSDPYYTSETVDTAQLIAEQYLRPAAMAALWDTPEELAQSWGKVRGNEFTRAGFDIAGWDLFSRVTNQSLSQAIGGTRTSVVAGVSLGIEKTLDDLLREVGRFVSDGYGRVKLKIKPGWDVEPVRAVRAAYPDLTLHVDANGAYDAGDATNEVMAELDNYNLAMIEQPFKPRDFLASAALQQRIDTSICLDESIVAVDDFRTMIALDAGRVVNLKVSRMGGITPTIEAHNLAAEHQIPVWCGGMHEFGIGRAANIAVSSLPGFTYPSDVSGSDKYYARDIVSPEIRAVAGNVAVPTSPGLGYDVDTDLISELAV